MSVPLVTIGIPAFKGKYFKEALLCWKRQTYANFEVVVQDDASPDHLKEVFDEVCGNDPRFSFARNEVNTAPNFVDNWHKTLEKARGEFFVLGSDDDLYEDDYLEKMVALAERYPQADLFDARHDLFSQRGVDVLSPRIPELMSQIEWVHALVFSPRFIVAQSAMCRTAALRAIGGFDNFPAAWGACDWLTWCRLSKNGVVTSQEVLMHWRNDGGNTSSTMTPYWTKQKLRALEIAHEKWIEFAEGLVPANCYDEHMVGVIRAKVGKGYFDWLGKYTYKYLKLCDYIRVVNQYRERGDLTRNHAIALIVAHAMMRVRLVLKGSRKEK